MNQEKKLHLIGIKGVGMTALAIYAKEKGYEVTGSDVQESFVTDDALKNSNIEVTDFNIQNINKGDLNITSAAFGKDNLEIKEASKKHADIKTYSEALKMLSSENQVIAVAGIHGKTTTTALISYLLTKANLDPSYIIGAGNINGLGKPGHAGQGDYFVLEADEYRKSPESMDSKFFDLTPQIEIITSIEMDHPDLFPTEEKVYDAFYKFACRIPRNGFIVLCHDYPKAKKLLRSLVDRKIETYGFSEGSLWQIIDFQENPQETSFNLLNQGKSHGPFKIQLPGQANALNATAAIITALKLGIDARVIKKYLPQFGGVKRRYEIIGQNENEVVIDDYAHHPHSIILTLEATKHKYPEAKIICLFQPHTYSRTKEMLSEFARAFKNADKVIITDIFASARESEVTITGEDLAFAIRKNQKNVKYISDWSKIIQEIIDNLDGKTIILTLGAGDIYKLGNNIWEHIIDENKKN